MILLFLLELSFELKPVILVPGLGGSSLWATITNQTLFNKCPEWLVNKKTLIFPINESLAASDPECYGLLFRMEINNAKIAHTEGVTFEVDSWGKFDTLGSLAGIVSYLEGKGYTKEKDLFGIPYDWIEYNPNSMLFNDLTKFIEKLVNDTQQKVTIIGHSMGAQVIRLLLTNKNTDEWVKKNIEGAGFLAPAFYGCLAPFNIVVQGVWDGIPRSSILEKSVRQMPSLISLWPNQEVFTNDLIVDVPTMPEGIRPSRFKDYLVSINLLDQDAQNMHRNIAPILTETPKEPNVKSFILYNSALPSPVQLNASNGFSIILGAGDGVCMIGGPKYACDKWMNAECLDLKQDSNDFDHFSMLNQITSLEKINNFIANSNPNPNPNKNTSNGALIGGVVGGVVAVIIIVVIVVVVVIKKKNNDQPSN